MALQQDLNTLEVWSAKKHAVYSLIHLNVKSSQLQERKIPVYFHTNWLVIILFVVIK